MARALPRLPVVREPVERVTALELFFDLVFVFALTRVTSLLAADPTIAGLGRGLLVLLIVWWAWVGFSWLTTTRNAEDELLRFTLVLTMAAMLVLGLAIPGVFGQDALAFALAFTVVEVLFLVVYALSARGDPALQRAIGRLALGIMALPVCLVAAALVAPGPWRVGLVAVGVVTAFLGPLVAGTGGWVVHPEHFAERHGLIIIIALGESVVAVGAGVEGGPVDPPVVAVAVLAVLTLAALWWLYFDVVARAAEQRLSSLTGAERNAMARDSYSYIHYLMVAGIVLLALGLKKTAAEPAKPLPEAAAIALVGGAALYLVGHLLFRLRNLHTVNVPRAVTAGVLLLLVWPATRWPAVVSLAVLAAVLSALVAYEVGRYGQQRRDIRHAGHDHDAADRPDRSPPSGSAPGGPDGPGDPPGRQSIA